MITTTSPSPSPSPSASNGGGGGHNVAYLRVSTLDQDTARQLDGMTFDHVFEDKASAKDSHRPELQACLRHLRTGDTLHVHSIDRLARSLKDLQEIVSALTGRGVTVRFHKEGLTFTSEQTSPTSMLMLQMLGAVAQFERALIRERQREGIDAAKKAGRQIGRQRSLSDEQVEMIKSRIKGGETLKAVAADLGVSRQTVYSALAKAAQGHETLVNS